MRQKKANWVTAIAIVIILSAIVVFAVKVQKNAGMQNENLNSSNSKGEVMKLTSPEFENNEMIPMKFTCEGADINPALEISGVPENAKSLVLIIKDPDAPKKTWIHWVVYDIEVTNEIAEDSVPGKQGANDSGGKNYSGPCPPSGVHRYFFNLYAMDNNLNLPEGKTSGEVEKAMQGHILAKAELIGLYKKQK